MQVRKIGFFVIVFFVLFFQQIVAQNIIWSEDFSSYANGTNNLLGNDPTVTKWTTEAYDADDGIILNNTTNYWGVYNGEFRVNDIEGRFVCTSNGVRGGENDNYWYSEAIDVSNYNQFSISMKGCSEGNMECASSGYGCGSADLLEGSYQLDGGAWILFFSMCGSSNGDINYGCVQDGNARILKLRVRAGTQAKAESYYFDDIKVTEVPYITGTTTVAGGLSTTLSVNATGGNWRSSNPAIATVDATGKVTGVSVGSVRIYYTTTGGCEVYIPFTVTPSCVPPNIINVTNGSRCDAGTVTLEATSSGGAIYWYTQPTGGVSIANGNSFTTPIVNTTTSYYVEASNGNCASSRNEVKATIIQTPVLVQTTPSARCGSGSVQLQAAFSAGTVSWYAQFSFGSSVGSGSVFNTPAINTSTSYYVESAIGGCVSSRYEVVATIHDLPVIVRLDTFNLNNVQLAVAGGVAPYQYILKNQTVSFFGNEVEILDLPNASYRITVKDANTCETSAVFRVYRPEIVLNPEFAFSPNGDNINDTWDIENIESFPLTEVAIYDRYGKQLKAYPASGFIPWDGFINGKKMPAQDYWYLIQIRETGERITGHFVLRR